MPKNEYRTQKVKGIKALAVEGYFVPYIHLIVTEAEELKKVSSFSFPLFARPCPVKPRHGFVDSRVVNNEGEVKAVWKELRKADPEGELVLMSPVEAEYNSVWTPNLLTVGPGHDGATSGKDVVTFPLISSMPWGLSKGCLKRAGLGEDDEPYIECVHAGNVTYFTQLRGGPPLTGNCYDFIPEEVVVERVVVPSGEDLLTWEKMVAEMPPGTVINHQKGSLTDHYSIHARVNNIPIITSREVSVGEKLAPIQTDSYDPMAVLKGLVVGGNPIGTPCPYQYVAMLLIGLHHSLSLTGAHGYWLGLAAGIMLRLGATALAGEARHQYGDTNHHPKPNRSDVYKEYLQLSFNDCLRGIPNNGNVLRYAKFSSTAIGGKAWAICALYTLKLAEAARQLAINKTEGDVKNLIAALNKAVNQAHNNGWWLNKFTPKEVFNAIQAKSITVLNNAPLIYTLGREVMGLSDKELNKGLDMLVALPEFTFKPPSVVSATLRVLPGTANMVLSLNTPLLRDRHRKLVIPMPDKFPQTGKIFLQSNDEGWELVRDTGNITKTVWQDERLIDE